jgi:hypothetical protein
MPFGLTNALATF